MTERHDRPVGEDDLHAFADGQLGEARRAAVESWLAERPDEAARVRAWQAQSRALHSAFDPVAQEPLPLRLRPDRLRDSAGMGLRWQAAAAAVLLLIGGGAGWYARGLLPAHPSAAVAALAAHRVFVAEVRHPVEVPASEEKHLVAWLSKRLGAPLAAPSLQADGFQLVGGRLLSTEEGPAAQFMYEDAEKRRLTLYVRPAQGPSTEFRYMAADGIGAFYWIGEPLAFALAGPLEREALLKLARRVYAQMPS